MTTIPEPTSEDFEKVRKAKGVQGATREFIDALEGKP